MLFSRPLAVVGPLALVLLLLGGNVQGEETSQHEKNIYKGTIHQKDGEKDVVFDLDKPEDRKRLEDHFRDGEIAELKKEKEVNLLAISWDLGLWTVVVFVLLLFALRKLAWGPMLQGLQRRESNIRSALDEAKRAQAEAESLRIRLEKESAGAQEKIQQMLEQGRRDTQKTTEEMVAKAKADIQTERHRLSREIELAKDQALQDLWTKTAQLATLVSSKAIGRQMNQDDHRRFVDEAIKEMGAAGQLAVKV